MTEEAKEPTIDKFLKLKHIGYTWSQNSIGNTTFKTFVKYARFQLCLITKTLMKDPVWDEYTEEEILVEFFAHSFHNDPNFLKDFEISISKGEVLDFNSWADLEMKRNAESVEAKVLGQADKVEFQPEDVMGEEQ